MPLYRLGSGLVRLERVIGMREVPPAAESPGARPVMRVFFDGCEAVDYEGADADALRAYAADCPPPPRDDPAEAPAPRQATQLIPAPGRQLGGGRRRKDVPGG